MRYLLFFSLLFSVALAQLQNSQWVFAAGLGCGPTGTNDTANMVLDFRSGVPTFTHFQTSMNIDKTCAAVCDTSGNLLLYTNGLEIYNGAHQRIVHGDSLHEYPLLDYVSEISGTIYPMYRLSQAALLLPTPDSMGLYHLLLISGKNGNNDVSYIMGWHLRDIVIDMRQDSGRGAVVSKSTIFKGIEVPGNFPISLSDGEMTTCRHANGRDWWIIVREQFSYYYRRWLLTPTGIHEEPRLQLGWNDGALPNNGRNGGSAWFSPDGTHYCESNFNGDSVPDFTLPQISGKIEVYDFDRCTGVLTPYQRFVSSDPLHFAKYAYDMGGVAISPNSRYLYKASRCYLYQYDLQAPNIAASEVLIDTINAVKYNYDFSLSYLVTAPDGKIYSANAMQILLRHKWL